MRVRRGSGRRRSGRFRTHLHHCEPWRRGNRQQHGRSDGDNNPVGPERSANFHGYPHGDPVILQGHLAYRGEQRDSRHGSGRGSYDESPAGRPTASEKEYGLYTSIPANTAYLALDISKGIATVDLSQEYASGGGSLAMMMRLTQVVYTLTQFDTVSGVRFQLDGKPVEVFGGEGIVLDHPIDRSDYEGLVTPAI